MITPQTLHETWLVITVIATLAILSIAVYLWRMFRWSSRKWFFWSLALVLVSVAVEHVSAEIKNWYNNVPPENVVIAWQWLAGRVQEAVVATLVLGYLVFGRNGNSGR